MYLVAFLIPPLAVLCCGKVFQALFNFALWVVAWLTLLIFGAGLLAWLVCAVHAVLVVGQNKNERRHSELIGALRGPRRVVRRSSAAPAQRRSASPNFDFLDQ